MIAQYYDPYASSPGLSDGAILMLLLGGAVVSGLIGAAIGGSKGKGGEGFLLGFLLGPIGWIISAVSEPSEEIRQRRLDEQARANAYWLAQQQPPQQPVAPAATVPCPWCAEQIQPGAVICRFCNRPADRPPSAYPPPPS